MKSVTLKNLFNKGLIATSIIVASSLAATVQANERIAFFVSDLSNVFHQSQATEAKRYAKEKYGAEVVIFDGKADSAVMTQNVDQVAAGAFDGASLHIWDGEAATPGVMEALEENIAMTSFFSPITDTGIPTARSDEATVSFDMGAQMAKEWMAANPNKPIVMVQLGWPNHTEVTSGRTNPFAQGVLSVAPNAKKLGRSGCQWWSRSRETDHRRPSYSAT
ncbi:Ribose ABC transporter substrate-binding protein [Vibrio sp. B1FLJ16]|uniref:substrate-binding domain-containing protein n=1 Tax=Vibrio sp. B1FLJ16 TaxID=2751178 RepID=UPI001AF3A003|nr:substrate-binding domain-containing protein [Vibrio sp. B1FLJ16]CAD7804866.1 Ribose ABC transporter substrate-binding protein [Vibrio sp. B1FLJ16]CAE6899323.1 Ribose ABC transporter substrate-binding protein [Vibrio sp. B1FLJ16]